MSAMDNCTVAVATNCDWDREYISPIIHVVSPVLYSDTRNLTKDTRRYRFTKLCILDPNATLALEKLMTRRIHIKIRPA